MIICIYKYNPCESCSSTLATSNNNVTSAAEAKLPSGEWCNSIDEAGMMWWPVYVYIHGNVVFLHQVI